MILRIGAIALIGLSTLASVGQQPSMDEPEKPKFYVTFVAEPVTVTAGHATTLDLHFHIQPGYHINSHTPKSEFLIPTKLVFDSSHDVSLAPPTYPKGTEFSFSFDPKEKLDVYAGNFTVGTRITAKAGQHVVRGTLHYQACNHAACFPPKSLPIEIIVNAK